MKELMRFNQGLASDEYGKFAARRQAEAGMTLSALGQQAGREDRARLAAQGIQAGLAQTGYGAQGQLSNLGLQQGLQAGAVQGQLGQGLAGLATGTAGQQAALQSGLGQNIANVNLAQGQAGLDASAQQIAAMQAYANAQGMGAQADANMFNRLLNIAGGVAATYAGTKLAQG